MDDKVTKYTYITGWQQPIDLAPQTIDLACCLMMMHVIKDFAVIRFSGRLVTVSCLRLNMLKSKWQSNENQCDEVMASSCEIALSLGIAVHLKMYKTHSEGGTFIDSFPQLKIHCSWCHHCLFLLLDVHLVAHYRECINSQHCVIYAH